MPNFVSGDTPVAVIYADENIEASDYALADIAGYILADIDGNTINLGQGYTNGAGLESTTITTGDSVATTISSGDGSTAVTFAPGS